MLSNAYNAENWKWCQSFLLDVPVTVGFESSMWFVCCRKLYVVLSVVLCLLASSLVAFFLFPRSVVVVDTGIRSVTVHFDHSNKLVLMNMTVGVSSFVLSYNLAYISWKNSNYKNSNSLIYYIYIHKNILMQWGKNYLVNTNCADERGF